jgi:hypothetical protein
MAIGGDGHIPQMGALRTHIRARYSSRLGAQARTLTRHKAAIDACLKERSMLASGIETEPFLYTVTAPFYTSSKRFSTVLAGLATRLRRSSDVAFAHDRGLLDRTPLLNRSPIAVGFGDVTAHNRPAISEAMVAGD